jgi:hypothetical protein
MNPLLDYLQESPFRYDPTAFTPMCRAFLNASSEQKEEFSAEARSMPYKSFLRTKYWGIVCGWKLYGNLRGDRPQCRRCKTPHRLNVHHGNYEIHGDEHRNLDKLDVLCRDCHSATHGKASVEQLVEIEKRREHGTIGGPSGLTDKQRAEKIRRGGA